MIMYPIPNLISFPSSCAKKIKSIYATKMFPDNQKSLVDYHTVSEKITSDDYATSIKFKMAYGSFHHQDNPGYITMDGMVGLQPRYVNLSPPDDKDGGDGRSMVEMQQQELQPEQPLQPPQPPSVVKLNQLVQSQQV